MDIYFSEYNTQYYTTAEWLYMSVCILVNDVRPEN